MLQRYTGGGAGWVYVLVNPTLPGICKIGQTRHTAARRARQLEREYGVAAPFEIASRHAVPDAPAVEAIAHRMLADCRVPQSELFRCDVATAQRVVKAAALSYEKPWALTVWLRRLLHPAYRRRGEWRRRQGGSEALLIILVVCVLAGAVIWIKPAPPSWLPQTVAAAMVLLERL
ncbi:MAG: GIY-YIG nuclease family protein [Acetobacteraceae bacterium]|nr:GIY-YIG nuclease family protein [Acetobacteraceae bacterium]